MRIALIRRVSITGFDGVNKFIALLAEGLAKLGHEPVIISLCHEGVEDRELTRWFKEAHCLDLEIPIHTLRHECGGSWLSIAWNWWWKGSKLLRKEGVDAAIVNGVVPLRFSPKIIVNHGVFTDGISTAGKLYRWVAKLLYRRYDAVACVSNKLRSEVKSDLGVDCRVVPLPMKLELYKPASLGERGNVIVHIGTRPIKNPQISIEAIKILRKRGYNVKLVMIGAPIGIPSDEAVEFRSGLMESEKLKLLCRAKALILPSSYETFSYVTLEAMACGTPVVVSGAVPEEVVIDGYNGIRVNSYDSRDYANALEKLLLNEELWLKLSRNGLEFVKQFDHVWIAKEYEAMIKKVL
jgi:glycosyltransferase involved in cell wall biosynthesis